MKFAICNEIFDGWKIDDTMAYAARIGYGAIELSPFTLAARAGDVGAAERRRLRETAARAGIEIAGLHWILARTEGFHLTTADTAVRARTADYLAEIVRLCADLGGTRVILGSPKQRSLEPGVELAQGWAWAQAALRPAIAAAAGAGVVICLEPLPAEDTNFINTAAEAVRFVEEADAPALQVILDVRAMSHEEKPIPQLIAETQAHLAYVHANDRNLKGPGFGAVDFKPIAAALRAAGYDGTVSVEVFTFEEGPETIATRSLEYLRQTFGAG